MAEAAGPFPHTRWTAVEQAGEPGHPGQEKALADLLPQYLPALRSYLVAQLRIPETSADDLLQGFLLDKVVRGGFLSQADRTRGKFRTYLIQALNHFVVSEFRKANARKRAPAQGWVSLEALVDEGVEIPEPSRPGGFDVGFARQVIAEVLRRMESQCQTAGRTDVWGVFEARLLGPIFDLGAPADYETLVRRFGFLSPGHAANILVTAKRMFARTLRAVVSEYVAGEHEIEAELEQLRAILATAGSAGVPHVDA